MKKIGLIGGISWISTMEYYRLINHHIRSKLGENNSAEMVIISLNQKVIDQFAKADKEEEIFKILETSLHNLKIAGANFGLLCANGVHRFYDRLIKTCDFPLLHIVDVTAAAIQKSNFKKVGLLGIKKTMEGSFYRDRLLSHGIQCIVPDTSDRNIIDEIIFSELTKGIFTKASKDIYLQIIRKLVTQGSQGIILGCTEIPLLITQKDIEIPLFSTTEIHCLAAVDKALE